MPKRATRIETEQRLLDAVGALLAEAGFSALGVNALARRAGVNKSLIYRYYGGMDGLLRAYAEAGEFWPPLEELLYDLEALLQRPPAERTAIFFQRYLRALRKRPRTLEILAWEVVDRNELTAHLEEVRERFGLAAARALAAPGELGGADADAIGAVIAGAIHYLLIRARKVRLYSGIDLGSDAGWARIEGAIAALLGAGAGPPGEGQG